MSKIKTPADSVSGENLLPGSLPAIFLLCPYLVEEVREQSGASSMRAQTPFIRPPLLHSHDLIPSQRPHLQILSHWGLGFNL